MKRALRINPVLPKEGEEQLYPTVELNFSKSTKLTRQNEAFLHIDELPDGSWRITRTANEIPKLEVVQSFDFKGFEAGLHKGRPVNPASIVVYGTDQVWEVEMVVQANDLPLKRFIQLNQQANGKWKLIYSRNLMPDVSKIAGWSIIRED